MIGLLLTPLIFWSFEDRRTLRLRLVSLALGFAFAVALAWWTGTPLYVGAACMAGCATRLGLPLGDAFAMGYVGLVAGLEVAMFTYVGVFALLMLWAPRPPAPAIPLIAAVSSVLACLGVAWGVLP